MTKKYSSTRSDLTQTKRYAAHVARRKASQEVEDWLREQGAVEGVKYDEDTGKPCRVFTIDLTKQ